MARLGVSPICNENDLPRVLRPKASSSVIARTSLVDEHFGGMSERGLQKKKNKAQWVLLKMCKQQRILEIGGGGGVFWRRLGVEGEMGRKKDGPEGEDI